jgi:hypothetical protein
MDLRVIGFSGMDLINLAQEAVNIWIPQNAGMGILEQLSHWWRLKEDSALTKLVISTQGRPCVRNIPAVEKLTQQFARVPFDKSIISAWHFCRAKCPQDKFVPCFAVV